MSPIPFNAGARAVAEENIPTTLKDANIFVYDFEDTGLPISDTSGNSIPGTWNVASGITYSQPGKLSNCISLNGISSRLTCTTISRWAYFSPQDAHSVSAWVYREGDASVGRAGAIMSQYYSTTGGRIWQLNIFNNGDATAANRVTWQYYDTTNAATTCTYNLQGPDLFTDDWVHLVGTRDGADMKIYVNGVEEGSITGGNGVMQQTESSAHQLNIGCVAKGTPAPDSFWNGRIDQLCGWNRALTQTEVTTLYNSGDGLPYTSW